jgi:hypothetical protein
MRCVVSFVPVIESEPHKRAIARVRHAGDAVGQSARSGSDAATDPSERHTLSYSGEAVEIKRLEENQSRSKTASTPLSLGRNPVP